MKNTIKHKTQNNPTRSERRSTPLVSLDDAQPQFFPRPYRMVEYNYSGQQTTPSPAKSL
jgi:hypothetical protein